MVTAIGLVVLAISVPNLLRSRIAANESSAVGSIRTINTAVTTYSSQHPDGGFPEKLSDLSAYIDASLATGERSGYRFEYEPVDQDGDGIVEGFSVEARPLVTGQSGQRIFSSNETGYISYQGNPAQPKELLDGGTPPEPPRKASSARRIMRKGSLSMIVGEPSSVAERIRAVAYRLGGYVESVRLSGEGAAAKEGCITVRIPAARYDDARREVRALGERVEDEEDDASDVTAKYVDLESNLRNYHAEEAQYLAIMRRSGSIKDTLAVAKELADVRGRIEQAQGQLNLITHQTQMSVLAVTLQREAIAEPTDVRWHPKAEIKAAFWDAADDLSVYANTMIAVLFRLPILILWTVTVLVFALCGWRLLRWLWKRLLPAPTAA